MFSFLFALLLMCCWVSRSTQLCGKTYHTAFWYSKVLSSPNYPSNYPPSTTCEWTITAPSGYRVEITFTDFSTEGYFTSGGGTCSSYSDTLAIYDSTYAASNKLRGKYCSSYLPARVYSSGRNLFLKFQTDSFTNSKGFQLKYQAVLPIPNTTICSPFNTNYQNNNIRYTGSSGYIESPLYGSKYPSNMQCTWVITVPQGKTIKLTFSEFNIGQLSYYCSYYYSRDQLQIKDGQYSFSSSLKTLCGRTFPSQVFSTQRYMWIRFISYSANYFPSNKTGFKARYEAVDMPESSSIGGIIASVIIAVVAIVSLVIICVCIAQRKRTPDHVNVQTPTTTQTTVQSTQNVTVYTPQNPQQIQGIVPPPVGNYPAPVGNYPPPSSGCPPPPPPQSGYQQPQAGISNPGYAPQSSIPIMPYPPQEVPHYPPPSYESVTAEQPGTAVNPNLPYPPPQSTGHQQSSPPYPPTQDTKQPSAPPL